MTALPRLAITVDGSPLEDRDARALTQVRVRQELSVPAQCEISFADPLGRLGGETAPRLGSEIRVEADGASPPIFEGELTAVELACDPERGKVIRLRSYDALHKLRSRRSVRAHVQVTAADLLRELASDLGLPFQVESAGPAFARVVQSGQSDLDLLVEVAARSGLYVALRNRTVCLLTLAGEGEPIELNLGSSLLEGRFEWNSAPGTSGLSVAGWDWARIEPRRGETSSARAERGGRALTETEAPGSSGDRPRINAAVESDVQAEALAQSELDWRAAMGRILRGVAEGNPSLAPGSLVHVTGVPAPFEGSYALASVTHVVDAVHGFVSEVSTAPPPPAAGKRDGAAVMTIGVVTRVDDPDKLGRVQVRLPAVGDVETGWICVVAPAAGKGKGLVALPDVDDHVLVQFPAGDFVHGVALGGVCGTQPAPEDWGVEGSAVKRTALRTPGGQQIRLDDKAGSARVENHDGSYIEMTPSRVVLHAKRDLTVEAPGRRIVLRANSVDFEQG